jgi:hypothetical protein
MDGQPDWDSRYAWLDGIKPLKLTRVDPEGVRLVGGAYVVHGRKWTLRPIEAELKLPPAKSTLYFASSEAEVNYDQGHGDSLIIPPDPASWPHVFEVLLA